MPLEIFSGRRKEKGNADTQERPEEGQFDYRSRLEQN